MTDVQSRIAALSTEKRELLEQRLAERVTDRAPGPQHRIGPRDRTQVTPLSMQQQREWTFGQFRAANNIPGAFRVEGEFDRDLLCQALTEVVERHEVLRSTIEHQTDGSRVQVVHPVTPVPVPIENLTHLSDEEQRAEVQRRWELEVVTPLPREQHQRLRIALLRLTAAEHVVLITTDHAAADLVSMGILVEEFAALYQMQRAGGGTLPPVAVQYGDFAVWQRQVEQERLDAETEHWQSTLQDVPSGLALPSDRPQPIAPTFEGDVYERDLNPKVTAGLRRFAEQEQASLAVILCAACAVLLYRYTGRDDLIIGEIVSGRNRPEIERIIGCFVGSVPMRVRISDELTLRELVRQARDVVVTAYSHQDLPVDGLLDRLELPPDASSSLTDMWLDVRTPPRRLEIPGLKITAEPLQSSLVPGPLTLGANPDADDVCLQWIYMIDMFDRDTVMLLAAQFEHILTALVSTPDITIDHVELTRDTATALPDALGADPATVVELFRRQTALTPDAPAVERAGVALTYAELDRDVQRLAFRLRACGVGPETTVGILLDRSPRLATAVLGVLAAGGAYVPLDVAYPLERTLATLTDAGVRVLITEAPLGSRVTDAQPDVLDHLIMFDDADTWPAPVEVPTLAPDLSTAAYVVYTSGSTGRPKGAVINHRALTTYAQEVAARLRMSSGDRVLQFASPGFDVLAEELFPTWLCGGCVVFPDRPLVTGGGDLTELVESARLTLIELPTAYWHEWVRELDQQKAVPPACLRLVIIGGERVLPERLATWHRFGTPLAHVYGLTETTVTSTVFEPDPDAPAHGWSNLSIGTALPSADLRVLDARMRPVPIGGTGELYIGGCTVARGYHGRPALTAHRFVADPVDVGGRLYRTGDLVRRRPDGNLEFLARVDTQLKVRGYRIEPTEIESAINRHKGVANSVVALHEPAPGDRRLVGYVVAQPGGVLDIADLRRFLDRELPTHLVPSALVEVPELPISANGKIDHAALPAPDGSRETVAEEYVAPATQAQHLLAKVVAAVVGVERVGVHDNFFELGGDSILAIQLVSRAQELGMRLTPYDVFTNPTVARLAVIVATGPTVDAEQGDISGPAPLTPSQRWLCTAWLADPHHSNLSALLDLHEPVEPDAVRDAIEAVVGHHDGLRQRILVAGEQTRARIAPRGDTTPFTVHDIESADDVVALAEVIAELQQGLNLSVGPVVRAALVRAAGRPDRLAVVVHRLVADEPSLRILLEDLSAALSDARHGRPVRLPAKTTSWQSWARRIVAHGRTELVRAQLPHWTSIVAGRSGRLPADSDGDGPPTVGTCDTVETALGADSADEVQRTAEELGCTPTGVLLAALGRTLSSWTGGDRHVVELVADDRVDLSEEVDLTRTVGSFTRSYPVELKCPISEPVEAALRAVKEHLRAVPGGGVAWQLLGQDADALPPSPVEVSFELRAAMACVASTVVSVSGTLPGNESPRNRRRLPLEVSALIRSGDIFVRWTYDEDRHGRSAIERIATRFLDEVHVLCALGRTGQAVHTPSDFPLARVDQGQLDNLLSRL